MKHAPENIRFDALAQLVRGGRLVTGVVAGTLGPHGADVVCRAPDGSSLDILGTSGTIARRIVQTGDRFANMGAMLARQVICRVHDRAGDGGATAAVIYERLLTDGLRMVAAGTDPHRLADELGLALDATIASLRQDALALSAQSAVAAVVQQSRHDNASWSQIEAAVHSAGADGWVDVRVARSDVATTEVIEGCTTAMVSAAVSGGMRVSVGAQAFGHAQVLVCAEPITDVRALAALAARVSVAGHERLLVVAPSIGDTVVEALNKSSRSSLQIIAVELGAANPLDSLGDIAASVVTRVCDPSAGDDLATVAVDDLGHCRRFWLSRAELGVVTADSPSRAERARSLRAQAEELAEDEKRSWLMSRVAAISGRTVLLRVPISTTHEKEDTLRRVSSLVRAGQRALAGGVVAGGGAALARADTGIPTVGAELLRRGIAEPLRHIARRGGWNPDVLLDETRSRGAHARFDVVAGQWVEDLDRVVDACEVLVVVLTTVVSAVRTAITASVLVGVRKPDWTVGL